MGIHYNNHEEAAATPPSNPQKSGGNLKIILIVLIVVLVIGNALTLYLFLNKQDGSKPIPNDTGQNNTPPIVNEVIDNEQADENSEPGKYEEIGIDLTSGEILVDWYEETIPVSHEELFGEERLAYHQENAKHSNIGVITAEEAGQVVQGPYTGSLVYNLLFSEMGVSKREAIKNNGEIIMLSTASGHNSCNGSYLKYLCTKNEELKITNLETPEEIQIDGSDDPFIKTNFSQYEKTDAMDDYEEIFEYATDKHIYQYKPETSNMIKYFALAGDYTIRTYSIFPSFIGGEGDPSEYFGRTPNIFEITWEDDSANEEAYLQEHRFFSGGQAAANYITNMDQLEQTGTSATGEPIYELTDIEQKSSEGASQSILEKMYDGIYAPDGDKLGFEEFLEKHPIIFWEDPFGNLIEYKNAAYMPAAEFAKPVVYLYPETDMDVSVKVYPNNGLTITEPAYKDGWLVKATPSGILYNYDDRTAYPYLFWEGNGLDYHVPKEGFVVTKDKVEEFLANKLAEQGLMAKEYDEFIEYWAPLMKEKQYYFVTFVPQAEFDLLAPLDISPEPDTVIRVFMDYHGLDTPIKVEPQTFTAPERSGFTVIEWGGARH
jgi:hypothetical protein